jgi:hypothetical protein
MVATQAVDMEVDKPYYLESLKARDTGTVDMILVTEAAASAASIASVASTISTASVSTAFN